jgi:hypothetical protein
VLLVAKIPKVLATDSKKEEKKTKIIQRNFPQKKIEEVKV